ncbi:MAG: hypothetical protein U9Q85_01610 [Patescibacteria group bacterium]|nr:hypothetical protein [Patescibacteria group bacterium]
MKKNLIIIIIIILILGLIVYQNIKTNQNENNFLENNKSLEITHRYVIKNNGYGCDIKNFNFFSHEWFNKNTLKIKKTTSIGIGADGLKEVRSNFDQEGNLNIFLIKKYCQGECPEIDTAECSEFTINNIPQGDFTLKFYYLDPSGKEIARYHGDKPEMFEIKNKNK